MHARRMAIWLAPLFLLAAPPLEAQVKPHTPAIPGFATGYYDGSSSLTSLGIGGRTRGTFQIWYRGDTLPRPTIIKNLGVRPTQGLTASTVPQDVEIVLSSTAKGFGSLDKTFANNLGNDATVFLARKIVNPPPLANHTDPDAPAFWIPGDQPFLYIQGPHFLWQTTIHTEPTTRTTGYTCASLSILSGSGGHSTSDASCGGSLTASYAGAQYSLDLAGALPNGPALFMLALRNHALAGAIPLPLDLGPLGMTGCLLAIDPWITLGTATDATGAARLSIPLPSPADSLFLHAQVVHGSTANPAGLATSNAAHSVIGSVGLLNYLYLYDVGPVATSGPFTANRPGPVLLYSR